ncbi:hypothetical protein C3943_13065 [Lysinibacillus sp. B2A1]|nr:hypothetical protein C3943_13065 [Lysinibacillus sp. B2A1]
MGKFDLTIKEVSEVKGEIQRFIDLEFSFLEIKDKNNLIFILKKIVFLKYLIRQESSNYILNALTSDIMYLIGNMKKGEERYYYFNIRSIIEQSLRLINNLTSTDTISNSSVMENTDSIVNQYNASINMDIIKDEYIKSCRYVHGNENANMNLAVMYQDCIQEKGIIEGISVKLNQLVKLLQALFDLIIITQNNLIDAAFFRRKTILEYLVGTKSFIVFETYKQE